MTNNWEKEFKQQFGAYMGLGLNDSISPNQAIAFISSLLQEQRQRMGREIEKLRKVEGKDNIFYGVAGEAYNSGLQAALNIVLGEGDKQ